MDTEEVIMWTPVRTLSSDEASAQQPPTHEARYPQQAGYPQRARCCECRRLIGLIKMFEGGLLIWKNNSTGDLKFDEEEELQTCIDDARYMLENHKHI